MRTFLTSISLLLTVFVGACGQADSKSFLFVTDEANILTNEQENSLSQELKELETSIGSQFAIIIINSLEGEKIEEYSLRMAETMKLGRKVYNDGLLITVSVSDRKMRIEVGLGLEKIIRDEIAADIIRVQMTPDFKQEKYYDGLLKAVQRIKTLIKTNQSDIGK